MRRIELEPAFRYDVESQSAYYEHRQDRVLADRFVLAVEDSIKAVGKSPERGRVRKFRSPLLQGFRLHAISRPI